MSKRKAVYNTPTASEAVSNGKKLGIAAICVLSVVIVALIVLIVLDGAGILYNPQKNETVIVPPIRQSGTDAQTDGDYNYVILTDGTVMIISCTLSAETTEINVPSTLGGYTVSAIGESAFAMITEMKLINVPEGIKYIGKAAFFGALNAKLYLPRSLEQIADSAFSGFDEPAGIYYAGTRAEWKNIKIGKDNAVLARTVCAES